jgi:hypothetical protein
MADCCDPIVFADDESEGPVIVSVGEQGPPGRPGPGGATFEFIQSTPVDAWTCNHNLGFRPNVSVKTLGGSEVEAEVLHASTNQVLIYFDLPQTGIANFS